MRHMLFATILLSIPLSAPVHAASSAKAEQSILIVSQKVVEASDAVKDVLAQLEKERAKVQADLAKEEGKLKAEDKKLVESQSKLSAEEFAKKRKEFEVLVNNVRFGLERKKIRMELAFSEARQKVITAFLKIVEGVRKDKGGIVLYAENIAAADPKTDLSADILAKLNKALPKVKVTFKSDEEIKKLIAQQQAQQQGK